MGWQSQVVCLVPPDYVHNFRLFQTRLCPQLCFSQTISTTLLCFSQTMYTTLLVVCLSQIDYGHHFTKILLAEYLFKEALIASPRDAPTTRKHAKRRNAPPPHIYCISLRRTNDQEARETTVCPCYFQTGPVRPRCDRREMNQRAAATTDLGSSFHGTRLH